MPFHKGLIPREGFCADVILKVIRQTALNPALLLPLILLTRLSKKGQNLSILHPKAFRRLKVLFYLALARKASSWWSDQVRNNWAEDKYDWSKEIVLVTGGAGGIGGDIVKMFEERGVTVVVLDIQPMSLAICVCSSLQPLHRWMLTIAIASKVHHYQCDLRSPENVAAVAVKIRAEVGNPTILINNAGVARGKSILDAQPADIRFTFDVNTLAHYWTVQNFLPSMVSKNHGMVVTIASYAAWITVPSLVDYSASKAAALSFHDGLTAELTTRYGAPKVRTVVVHPSHTKTALFTGFDQKTDFLIPMQDPGSIAEAVVKQVLTGRSGKVVVPEAGRFVSALSVVPAWYAVTARARAESYMTNFRGRQVIENVDAPYTEDGSGKSQNDTSESTVLVSNV